MKRLLWKISSGDWVIIEQCEKRTQNLFLLLGLWVFLLFVITLLSTFYAFEQIFHDTAIDLAIALFFGFAIFNIYLFLLLTLTKNVLPQIRYGEAKLSLIGRILFLAFLAVIISKPLEEYVFRNSLTGLVAEYKVGLIDSVETTINTYYANEIKKLENDIQRQKGLHSEGSLALTNNLSSLASKKTSLLKKQNEAISVGKAKIVNASFFMKRVKFMVSSKPLSYLITLAVVFLFVFPVYVKFRIRDSQDYFELKEKYETELVSTAYESFKEDYASMFRTKYSVDSSFQELYEDPPFNTQPIVKYPIIGSQSDFLKDLYNV